MTLSILQRTISVALFSAAIGCGSTTAQRQPPDNNVVTEAEVAKSAHEPIEQLLQRKFPGVQVLRNADGEITLQIRGMTSSTGAPKQPLVVVNDMEMAIGPGGLESIVNPYDIESIRVLRGPETAIYGVRGADGVIVIRTKGTVKKK